MEVEQTIFRLYERTLYIFAEDDPRRQNAASRKCTPTRCCYAAQACLLTLVIMMSALVGSLHSAYVGTAGCFGPTLDAAVASWTGGNGGNTSVSSGSGSGSGSGAGGTTPWQSYFRDDDMFFIQILEGDGPGSVVSSTQLPRAVPTDAPPFEPHFLFAFSYAVLQLADTPYFLSNRSGGSALLQHDFRYFNVSVPIACSEASSPFASLLGRLVAFDPAAVNAAMWSFADRQGFLRNIGTGEDFNWYTPANDMVLSVARAPNAWDGFASFLYRIGGLVLSQIAFLALSCLAAIFLRSLLTSGMAVVYPFMACLRACLPRHAGMSAAVPEREINATFPWLGASVARIRLIGDSAAPFIAAHLIFHVIVYICTQLAAYSLMTVLFQFKSVPADLTPSLWATWLLLEWASFCYLRTAASIRLVPLAINVLWLGFYTYFYVCPYAFFSEAEMIFTLCSLLVFLLFIQHVEVPALRHGLVGYEKPRQVLTRLYTRVADGSVDIPPLWSILLAQNYTVPLDVYEEGIPAIHVQVPGAGGAGGAAGGGDAAQAGDDGTAGASQQPHAGTVLSGSPGSPRSHPLPNAGSGGAATAAAPAPISVVTAGAEEDGDGSSARGVPLLREHALGR